MSFDPIGAAIGLLPLVGEQFKAFKNRDEVKSLFRLVEDDVAGAASLPREVRPVVLEKLAEIREDGYVLAAIQKYLEHGDIEAMPALKRRLQQLVNLGDERIADHVVVAFFVDAVESNAARAKRSDRDAAHLDAELTRRQMSAQIGRLTDAFNKTVSERTDWRATQMVPPRQEVGRATDLGRGFERELSWLEALRPEEAHALRTAIDAGGTERLESLIDAPQRWLEAASPEAWETLGQLLIRAQRSDAARRAFRVAADHPAVSDRVRDLVRAAVAAQTAGDEAAYAELLNDAEGQASGHAAVVVARALELDDAAKELDRLAAVTPLDDRQAVQLELLRAERHLRLEDVESAGDAVAAAYAVDPDDPGVQEAQAVLELARAQIAVVEGREPDRSALVAAGEQFEPQAIELRGDGRRDDAAILWARAIQAYALAGEERRANRLLDEADTSDLSPDAALGVSQAAMLLKRFTEARDLLAGTSGDEQALIRAEAAVLAGDAPLMQSEAEVLDRLLDAEESLRFRAAFALLGAAVSSAAIPWSERAEAIIAAERPWVAALLRAELLTDRGELDEAQTLLLPHSDRPPVLRSLVDLAARRDDWDEALRLSSALLARAPDERDRIRHAVLLLRTGERDAGERELVVLGRDPALSTDARDEAYRRAAEEANRRLDYSTLADVAAEWDAFSPSADATWLRLFALTRQARHDDALALWRDRSPDIVSEQQGLLVSEIFVVGAPPAEAMEQLAALSDRFGRPETFEYNLILHALRFGSLDLSEDLDTRVREAFDSFPARFPDSTLLWTESLDAENPAASFAELYRRSWDEHGERLDALERGIAEGQQAVCVLAAATGRPLGEVWLRLPALPLGYGDPELARLEQLDAVAALDGRGAVWAPSALHVAGGLGTPFDQLLRNLLPASFIAQATLDAAMRVLPDPPESERTEAGWAPELGKVVVTQWSDAQISRERARAQGTLDLARDIPRRPDLDVDSDDELEQLLGEDLNLAARTWPASHSVARREGLPLYSDDRYERLGARQMGLRSFGTLALLDALVDRGQLTDEQRVDARSRLLRTGAWGIDPTDTELIDLARETEWELSRELAMIMFDRTAWRARPVRVMETLILTLGACADEKEDALAPWVARVVDAPATVFGAAWEAAATVLMTLVLSPDIIRPAVSPDAAHSIIRALRELPYFRLFQKDRDVVAAGVNGNLEAIESDDGELRAYFFRLLLSRVPPEDRDRIIATFVR